MGVLFDVTPETTADLSLRYTYTHLEGEDVSVGRGARYRMEDVDAHALRFGALWRGNASENLSWRIGAAYERVFDGDAESTLSDVVPLKLDTPTLEGHYGIFEASALMKPSASSPWSFDLSLKGYAGVRVGVAGSASVFYAF